MIEIPRIDRTFAFSLPTRAILIASLVFASSCGTQINSLRNAARITSGAEGVPPGLTSFVISDTSPTKNFPLNLAYGLEIGAHTQYCILENASNSNACIWRTGALPATYFDSSADGPLTMTLFLKNANGISDPVTSNTVTIDRTPPALSSATVSNSDPTNNPVYSLVWGAVTGGTYSDYCILENNTSVAACGWQSGSLPSSFTVTATNGPKTLYVWLRDAAGNVSFPTNTAAVTLNLAAPTVAFTSPAAGSSITAATAASFAISGTCSENGRNVVISGAGSATVACAGGAWSTTVNVSAAADGTITLYADHSNSAGTSAAQASRSFNKDATLPTVAITSPAAGSIVNNANKTAFPISGTCSENGRNVVLSGAGSATVACAGGAWSTTLDVSAAADGAITVYADHSDSAGNNAVQASRSFNKDATLPTVAITSPAAGSIVNNANKTAFPISGTCSENGRNVVISGAGSATVACAGGAWSTTLDVSAAADGAITVYADHSDAAGNNAVQASRSFNKDATLPTVAITSPAAGSIVNNASKTAFPISGTCSENGRNVVISGAGSATVACAGGAWSTTLDVSAAADGAITVYADHSDAAGNNAVQASRSFNKDATLPTVAITSPAAGASIYTVNMTTFAVSGTCSENGRNVVLSGGASGNATCTAGAWSATLDFSGASDGTVTLYADHTDAAGNNAVQASRNFNKDTGIPTLTIASPAAGSYVNSANFSSFTVSGACSENGQNVVVTGDAAATVVCTAGAWTANLDFTAAANGSVSITANHSDSAGNAANPQSRSFTKDSANPTMAITYPNGGELFAGGSTVTITWTAADNVGVTTVDLKYSTDGGTNWITIQDNNSNTGSYSWTVPSVNSSTVRVRGIAFDAAGNATSDASNSDFTVDSSAPTVAITSPAANSALTILNSNAFAVSGTCSENGRTVSVAGASGAWSATPTCSGGAWTTTFKSAIDLDGNIAPAGASLVNVYHLNDANGAGTVVDSVSGNNGTPGAGVTLGGTGKISKKGAFNGNGTNGKIDVATTSVPLGNSARTVTMWINAASLPGVGGQQCMLGWGVQAAESAQMLCLYNNGGTQTIEFGGMSDDFYLPYTAATGTWIFLAFTYDGTNAGISINGAAPTYESHPLWNTGANSLTIGGLSWLPCCGFVGDIDEIAIWNTALTPAQIATVYAYQSGPYFADGAFSVTADLTDAAGNAATQASRSFVKDTVRPTLTFTSPAPGTFITPANVSSFPLTGTCSESGMGMTVYFNGVFKGGISCIANAWSYSANFSGEAEGNVVVKIGQSDSAGNGAYPQPTLTLVKDTSAPTLAFSTPAAGAYVSLANQSAFAVTGTCSENGRTITFSGAGSGTATCTAGAWSKTFDLTAAAQGSITVLADMTDAAGNAAPQASRSFTKDTVAPTLAFSTPAAMTSANSATYTSFPVTGTCTENGINVVISGAVSTTASCSGGTWSANLNLSALGQGTFTVNIDQTDAAGNAATQQSRNFDLDTLAPNAANPVAWSIPGPTTSTSLTAAWTKSNSGDFANEKIQFYADGTCGTTSGGLIDLASNTIQTRAFTAPGEGTYSYVLTSFDAAGNSTASACSTAITVDQTPPAAPTNLSWQYGALSNQATQNLLWTKSVSTDVVDQSVRFFSDGTCTTPVAGWNSLGSATLQSTSLTAPADGTYSAMVRAVDGAGNQADSACSPSTTLDTVVPALASVTITNATPTSSQTFGLTYGAITDSYTSYCIRENNTAVGGCSWVVGSLPASFNVADVNENKTLSVWIKDGAGNVSTRVDSNVVAYNNGIVLSPLTSTATATTSSTAVASARALATTIQLASGDLLAVGGTGSTTDVNFVTNSVLKFKTGYTVGNHRWSSLAPMLTARMLPGVVELANGNVLAIGGCTILPYYSSYGTAATEVYVPADNRWYKRTNMNTPRCFHTTTLLNSGKVLVVGGLDGSGNAVSTYELYDPTADSWTQGTFAGGATLAGFTANKLSDGRVFFAGGYGSAGWSQVGSFIYDPGTDTFTAKANMNTGRQTHASVLLTAAETGAAGDTVMVFGGYAGAFLSSVEAYDVATNAWTVKNSMANTRSDFPNFAINNGGGTVYIIGGTNGTPMTAVERYTWSTNTWANRTALPSSQANQIIGKLGDGKIISAGGVSTDAANNSTSPYIFEIDSGANSVTAGIHFPRNVQNVGAITLNDGRVLFCGGYSVGDGSNMNECLTYDPRVNGFSGVGKLNSSRAAVRMVKFGNGIIAMVGGFGGSNSNALQFFDSTTDTITTGANIPAPTYNPAILALSGNKLIHAGGLASSYSTATNAAYIYDYDTNTWTAAANMPGAVGNAAFTKTPSGKVFVHGGYAKVTGVDTYYNTLYQYNEVGNTWSTLTSSSAVRGWHNLTAYTNGGNEFLLAAGGENAVSFGTVLRSAEKYDITNNTWASAGSMPGTTNGKKAIHAAYFPAGSNNVFEIGGYGGDQSAVYAYSISGNSWSTKTALNNTQYNSWMSTVPLLDGRIFVYCGMYGSDYTKPAEVYNLTTPVVYTASGSNNNLVFSLTSGAGTLYEKIRTFIPPFPLSGGPSRVTVTDGNGHSVSADVNY